jgi:peroxiredoxin
MLFISRIMMFKNMARMSSHFPLLTLIAILGLGISIYGYATSVFSPLSSAESNMFNTVSIVLAGTGFVFFILYNFWYSSLGREINPILRVEQPLPAFKVIDTQGKSVHSDSFKGTPTIYIFFRGNWCPLCMAQIKEVSSKYRELSSLGAKVALISPQPEKNTQGLADKFDVPFMFLTDVDNRAAKTLGIEMKNGLPAGMEMMGYNKDTVYPTVIITDKNGMIIYRDMTNNYRIRPEPDEFISILNDNVQLV